MNNADEIAASRAHSDFQEQLQEMLLYMVTHELRTPVMTIMGFADILLDDWQKSTDVARSQQHLERIRAAAQRQNSIIQGLEQIANLQHHPLQLNATNISELVREQLDRLLPASHKFVTRIANVDPAQVDATMTGTALRALLSILVIVAQSSPNPAVELGTMDGSYFLRLDGSGIDLGVEKDLAPLLRRLQSNPNFAGAGLNLLTAATVIDRHGGKLWIPKATAEEMAFHFTL